MTLEFTTTACVRPEIIDQTYQSFTTRLTGIDYKESTLYINIDPLPDNRDAMEVVEVAKKYFGNVVYNIAKTPSFPSAVKWCFEQPQKEVFFHLEDDWIMIRDCTYQELYNLLINKNIKNKNLAAIHLRAYKLKHKKLCLSPSLWKNESAKKIINRIKEDQNPEQSIRRASFIGMQYPANNRLIMLSDIGRGWLDQSNLKKEKEKHFAKWINK